MKNHELICHTCFSKVYHHPIEEITLGKIMINGSYGKCHLCHQNIKERYHWITKNDIITKFNNLFYKIDQIWAEINKSKFITYNASNFQNTIDLNKCHNLTLDYDASYWTTKINQYIKNPPLL